MHKDPLRQVTGQLIRPFLQNISTETANDAYGCMHSWIDTF